MFSVIHSFLNSLSKVYFTFIHFKEESICSFLFALLDFPQITNTTPAVDNIHPYALQPSSIGRQIYSFFTEFHFKMQFFIYWYTSLPGRQKNRPTSPTALKPSTSFLPWNEQHEIGVIHLTVECVCFVSRTTQYQTMRRHSTRKNKTNV